MPVTDNLSYSVVDNKLTISSIRTNAIEGDIALSGSLDVSSNLSVKEDSIFFQSVKVNGDFDVQGTLRVPTLYAETLITKSTIEHKEPVAWASDRGGIEGKGLVWQRDKKNVDIFIYKSDPNRIFTNLNIELHRANSYVIDGTPVLTVDTLGPGILNSSLRKVGRLKNLTVDGDVILGEHIFFNVSSGRLGIGTDHANAALSLVDNGVELVMGSIDDGFGNIGTYTSHDLGLVTDNTTRIKITRGGKVIFGDPKAVNADVTINGKLYVKELIYDNKDTLLDKKGNLNLSGNLVVNKSISSQEDSLFQKNLTVVKSINVYEDSEFKQNLGVKANLTVEGEFRAPIVYADTLVTKTVIERKEPLVFSSVNGGIDGKGIIWQRDKKNVDIFIYKSDPNRIETNLDIELTRSNSIRIDGTTLLSIDTLGSSVLHSNLRRVGRLKDLIVEGDTIIGEHLFFDSKSKKVGIGTNNGHSIFSVVDRGIELVTGSIQGEEGNIGTFTSHDLGLITEGVTRVKITKSGKVIFGDTKTASADVTINGKLFVKELIVDQRQDRTGPLEFKALPDASNYGRGMLFTGQGAHKQFTLAINDQFYSTESINLEKDRGYFIDNSLVLTKDTLGSTVTKSSIKELGILNSLHVEGDVNLSNVFEIKNGKILLGQAEIDTKNGLTMIGSKFELQAENQSIKIVNDNIMLGSKDRPMAHAIVNGKMSIGIQTVGDNAQLEVAGNVRFADKLFTVGSSAPTIGKYRKGDIVWNEDPRETGYVGWVCIRDGNPGIWRGFGQIGVE